MNAQDVAEKLLVDQLLERRGKCSPGSPPWVKYNEMLGDLGRPEYDPPHTKYLPNGDRVCVVTQKHWSRWEHANGGSPARQIELWDGVTRYAADEPVHTPYTENKLTEQEWSDLYFEHTGRRPEKGKHGRHPECQE